MINKLIYKLSIYIILLVAPFSVFCANNITNSTEFDLYKIHQEGNLNVRALKSWNRIPDFSSTVALELRAKGLDVLSATLSDIESWLDNATFNFTPTQRESLQYLVAEFQKINSSQHQDSQSDNNNQVLFFDYIEKEKIDEIHNDLKKSTINQYASLQEVNSQIHTHENQIEELSQRIFILENTQVAKINILYFDSPVTAVDSNERLVHFNSPKNYGERSVNFQTVEYYKLYPKVDFGNEINRNEYYAEDIPPGKAAAQKVYEQIQYELGSLKESIKSAQNSLQELHLKSATELSAIESQLFTTRQEDIELFFADYSKYIADLQGRYETIKDTRPDYTYADFVSQLPNLKETDQEILNKLNDIFSYYFARMVMFDGYINDNIPIRMSLLFDGYRVYGFYWYKKVGIPFLLSGSIDENFNITLQETSDIPSSQSNSTGEFSGFISHDLSKIQGEWSSADKKFSFSLEKNSKSNAFETIKTSAFLYKDMTIERIFSNIAFIPGQELIQDNQSIFFDNHKNIDLYLKNIITDKSRSILGNFDDNRHHNENSKVIVYFNENFLIVESTSYTYEGGAHGYYGRTYINYDLDRTQNIDLDKFKSLFHVSSSDLTRLINKNARQLFGIGDDARYEDIESDCLNVDSIHLTDNFYLCKKGIVFVYNPYEIACYASGIIKILVPWSDLQDGITKEGISLVERIKAQ